LPVSKSAEKEMRSSERKRLRNKPLDTLCKTNIAKAERLILSEDLEAARKEVTTAVSTLDRAAERGIIHSNNAARRKSRLLKKLNELKSLRPKLQRQRAKRSRSVPLASVPPNEENSRSEE
jgi:small subunit ribosomal protein S20